MHTFAACFLENVCFSKFLDVAYHDHDSRFRAKSSSRASMLSVEKLGELDEVSLGRCMCQSKHGFRDVQSAELYKLQDQLT